MFTNNPLFFPAFTNISQPSEVPILRSNQPDIWFAIEPKTEKVFVYRELYVSKVLAIDLADMILDAEKYDGLIRYGMLDSSLWHQRGDTGPSLADQMIGRGCRWRPADRSKGSRVAGKNEIHRRLQVDQYTEAPRIVFFNTCVQIIADLPTLPIVHPALTHSRGRGVYWGAHWCGRLDTNPRLLTIPNSMLRCGCLEGWLVLPYPLDCNPRSGYKREDLPD
jgi:hypothetical protein